MTTPKKTNWPLVLLLWVAGLGAAAQYGKVSVVYDRLGPIYPEAGAALGWTVSLVGFLGMFLGVIAGIVVARVRFRRALLGGLWIGAALSVVQAFLPPLPIFLLSRAIEGVSHLALVVAAPTLIAAVTAPEDTRRTLTLWGTFFGVAFSVLVFGGLPLADRFGVGGLFLAHAGVMAAMALILSSRLPRIEEEPPAIDMSPKGLVQRHVAIYRSPWIGASGVGWLFYTFCFVSLLTLLPGFLDDSVRALVIGAMPLVSIVSSLTLGVFILRFITAPQLIIGGFVLTALAAALLVVFAANPVLCLLLAAALGLVQGASFAAVAELNTKTEDRAAAYGSMAQTGNIGNTLGTPVMAAVIAASGYGGLMIVSTLILLLGAGAHLWLAGLRRTAPGRDN